MRPWLSTLTAVCVLALGLPVPGVAGELNPVSRHGPAEASDRPTGRLLVRWRSAQPVPASSLRQSEGLTPAVRALADRTGLAVVQSRPVAGRLHVLTLLTVPAADSEAGALARLRADPSVEWAGRDQRRYPHAMPSDPDFGQQWSLQPPVLPPAGTLIAAIDAQTAWTTTTGSTGVVIAQLDTGVRFDHPDLLRAQDGGRLLPGYDFVSADPGSAPATYLTANDGDGWDPDASDPGDWVAANDPILTPDSKCLPSGTTSEPSSWHGTRTAGILGALTNNGTGIAGTTWSGWILPVRVLGKCGGYDSDIIAGMQWAAGIDVVDNNNQTVPRNPYPARILSMSLGGTGSCPPAYSDVLQTLLARGVLVVASAGNEGGPVDTPANCPGVAGIAGLRQAGTKVGYSSLGPEIAVAAPAGNCGQLAASGGPCLYEILTSLNLGGTVPGANAYTDEVTNPNLGTSFSAPAAAATAALMLSVNGNLTGPQLIARLKEGASAFPTNSADATTQPPVCHVPASATDLQNSECICTTAVCGAGMLNARGAVRAGLRPIAAVVTPSVVAPGQSVSLSAAGSAAACQHAITAYRWQVGGSTVSSASSATLTAPASGTVSVTLTVTDDQALSDSVTITLSPSSITAVSTSTGSAAPATAGSTACPVALNPGAPLATAALSATVAAAPVGQPTTLSWSSTNAAQCEASGGGDGDGWLGNRAPSGSTTVQEATPGTYTFGLTCFGATASPPQSTTITIAYQPTVSLTSSQSTAQPGHPVTLTWSSTNATSCTAAGGTSGDGWTQGSVTPSGTARVTENQAGSYTYTLNCANGPLTAQGQTTLAVSAPSGGGGGAVDAAALLALGLLAGSRATSRPAASRGPRGARHPPAEDR